MYFKTLSAMPNWASPLAVVVIGFVILQLTTNYFWRVMLLRGCKPFVLVLSGIGVGVHEMGHYIACKLFNHQVHRVDLFYPQQNGQLGIVEHSYDTTSFYQVVGQLFIGLAPIPAGLGASYLITVVCWPDFDIILFVDRLEEFIWYAPLSDTFLLSAKAVVSLYEYMLAESVGTFFVWSLLMTSIVSNLIPSRADLMGASRGLVAFGMLALVGCLVFGADTLESLLSTALASMFALFLAFSGIVFLTHFIATLFVVFITRQIRD